MPVTPARDNLDAVAAHVGPEAAALLRPLLDALLPTVADPEMAANNLERLLAQPAARDRLPALLDPRGRGLDTVLQLLATSQFFADTLVTYPDALDGVLRPAGRNPSTAELTAALRAEVDAAADDAGVLRAFRRFRRLQMLRVGINDVVRDRPLEEIGRDLARVADAAVGVALDVAVRAADRRYGPPMTADGRPARAAVLAFGKLGGDELNYSSDLDLMVVYDEDGETAGRRGGAVSNAEFYARAVTELVRLLSSHTANGFAYRVDLRLRPEGQHGPPARSLASTLSYYDVMGRTWERQALIKVRPCGGDPDLGREFVDAVTPFVYRKYFSFAEINEVKALKRQMEARAARGGADSADVKTGRGGIRDIEYTVQFLQLLNGGDLPAVRQRNTLLALEALEIAGCLTGNETYILADAYRFLRKTEHRLQLLFDLQTHRLPAAPDELRRLARRMGYTELLRNAEWGVRNEEKSAGPPSALAPQRRSPLDEPTGPRLDTRDLLVDPLDQFLKDLHDKTRLDRTILDHLLHQTFPDTGGPVGASPADPVSDLILDPGPDEGTVRAVLGRYPFRDVGRAYLHLTQLAREPVRFLSHRRCRHFLASIAPQLLNAVAAAPDPDEALANLESVTASLGAKAVLYELFSTNPPTLRLYVDLCAGSPFLSGLLKNNPGMIDELLDTLVRDQPRTADELHAELAELLRGATDPDPILFSFRDKELLRIGVRDLLGKATVRETTAALSDLADAVLDAVFALSEAAVQRRYGTPKLQVPESQVPGSSARNLEPGTLELGTCPYVVVGLGKLGGREISYHSDLDLLLVFAGDGTTDGAEPTTNAHYFTELAQRAIKALTRVGPMGRLYAVDMRLRPTGKSGSLVVPLDELGRYYADAGCQPWERLALTRGRVVRGEPGFAAAVLTAVREAVLARPWCPATADGIRAMRARLEATAPADSLKRGPGGLADVEFAVQLLQLKHGRDRPELMRANVWEALDAARAAGLLAADEADALAAGYSFLRLVEARLRVVTDRPLTALPDGPDDRVKLARRLGFAAADAFLAELRRVTAAVRRHYEAVTARER
jgi:glutamate-ammonia-ligase adenylyltransferase